MKRGYVLWRFVTPLTLRCVKCLAPLLRPRGACETQHPMKPPDASREVVPCPQKIIVPGELNQNVPSTAALACYVPMGAMYSVCASQFVKVKNHALDRGHYSRVDRSAHGLHRLAHL